MEIINNIAYKLTEITSHSKILVLFNVGMIYSIGLLFLLISVVILFKEIEGGIKK